MRIFRLKVRLYNYNTVQGEKYISHAVGRRTPIFWCWNLLWLDSLFQGLNTHPFFGQKFTQCEHSSIFQTKNYDRNQNFGWKILKCKCYFCPKINVHLEVKMISIDYLKLLCSTKNCLYTYTKLSGRPDNKTWKAGLALFRPDSLSGILYGPIIRPKFLPDNGVWVYN